jgi:hypothetical protein
VVDVAAAGIEEDHSPVDAQGVTQHLGHVAGIIGRVSGAADTIRVHAIDHGGDFPIAEAEDMHARVDVPGRPDDVRILAPRVGTDGAILHDVAPIVGHGPLAAGVQRELLFAGRLFGGLADGGGGPVHNLLHPLVIDFPQVEARINLGGVGSEALGARQKAAGVGVRAMHPDVPGRRRGLRRLIPNALDQAGPHADQVAHHQGHALVPLLKKEDLGLERVEDARGLAVSKVTRHRATQGGRDVGLGVAGFQGH